MHANPSSLSFLSSHCLYQNPIPCPTSTPHGVWGLPWGSWKFVLSFGEGSRLSPLYLRWETWIRASVVSVLISYFHCKINKTAASLVLVILYKTVIFIFLEIRSVSQVNLNVVTSGHPVRYSNSKDSLYYNH